jgi:uncharacterized protein YjiK
MFSKSLHWQSHENTLMATTTNGSLFIAAPTKDGFFEISKDGKLISQTPFDCIEDACQYAEDMNGKSNYTGTLETRIDAFFDNLTC